MTNRDNTIDVNDVERAMQQMGKMQQGRARSNGPQPHSSNHAEMNEVFSMPESQRMQQERREASIVESVSDFTNFIAGFLEETAQEEITRTQQFAEHLRALAQRVRETGIGSQR